jgi:hypothetical protein
MALTMGMLADGAASEAERGRVFGKITGVSMVCGIVAPFIGGQLTKPDGIGQLVGGPEIAGGHFQVPWGNIQLSPQ